MPPNYLLQHTQIITEVDVKLNKWHITIEKLYRKRNWNSTKFKKNITPHWDRTTNLKRSRREISHCASRQLGGSGLKRPCKLQQVIMSACAHLQCTAATICYFRGHSHCVLEKHNANVAVNDESGGICCTDTVSTTVPTQFWLNNIHQRANTISTLEKHPK